MKAAVLRSPEDLVVLDVADPECGLDEIVIRVGAAGICGSDLASFATGAYVRPDHIMGHEFSGTVARVGEGVKSIRPGVRVTVLPLGQCGRCRSCHLGLTHICHHGIRDAVGYGHPGGFAEYVRVPAAELNRNVFAVPDAVDDSAAALVEVFAVAVHACRRMALSREQSCVVMGLGPVGLAVMQVLRAQGLTRLVGIDASRMRREKGLRCGAAAVADFDGMRDQVRTVSGSDPNQACGGADAVIEVSGAHTLLNAASGLLRSGGTIGMLALYKNASMTDLNDRVGREIDTKGCFGYSTADFTHALELLEQRRIDASMLVTATFPLAEIADAFAAQADAHSHVKVQLRP